ncbi:hypothetical protein MKZ91_31005, partial [Ensifer sp. MJa1]
HPHVEIELSPERAAAGDHSRIAFRPTKWKLFREGQKPVTAAAPKDVVEDRTVADQEPQLIAQAS